MWELRLCLFGEYSRNEPGPTPYRHIDDRVFIAENVSAVSETVVENAEMASRLKRIPVERVWDLLRCVDPEMYRLTRLGSDARRYEHKPG